MSKTAIALLSVAGVGLLFTTSYTVGLWPPDAAAPIYRDGLAIASSWSDRLERVATAGILIGGVIALGVASWRARSADQQASAAQKQVDTALQQVDTAQRQVATAQRQAETAYQGLLNERYQKGAEMLGSSVLSVRFAGIYALGQLAADHPEQYHTQIMQLLCAFVRHPPETDAPRVRTEGSARVDVTETVVWIGSHRNRAIEALSEYQPDLTDAHLQEAYLGGADLSSALLENANLKGAWLAGTNLSGAFMWRTNMHGARLEGTLLSDADLWLADISEADFENTSFVDANLAEANLSTEMADLDHYIQFRNVDFSRADLLAANLTGTKCIGVRFDGAQLRMTNLTGAVLGSDDEYRVNGLTQAQVDQVRWEGLNVPTFDGTLDANTGKPIDAPEGRYCGPTFPDYYV